MPSFAYIAVEAATGKERRGSCTGGSAAQVIAELKAQGLFPTDVTLETGTADSAKVKSRKARPAPAVPLWHRGAGGPKERATFTRQLATMIKAGLPVLRALEVLARQQPIGPQRAAIETLAETIRSGGTLSDGLAQFPRQYDRLYINMVKAGEAGGALDVVLLRLAEFLEKSQKIRGRVKTAMTYPLIIMAVAVAVVGALVVFVVPRFEGIFASMLKGQSLPVLTRAVLAVSEVAQSHLLLALIGVAVVFVVSRWAIRTPKGERGIDRLTLLVPVLGDLVLKTAVARFTRTLGTLLGSGVQILEALQITRDTAGNVHVAEAVDAVRMRVKAGEGIARPLEETVVFPGMVSSMIEVGEETGQLPEMLERVADTYEDEVDNAVAALTSILEPIMIVFMAVVVGTIVVALFLPLVSIVQSLS